MDLSYAVLTSILSLCTGMAIAFTWQSFRRNKKMPHAIPAATLQLDTLGLKVVYNDLVEAVLSWNQEADEGHRIRPAGLPMRVILNEKRNAIYVMAGRDGGPQGYPVVTVTLMADNTFRIHEGSYGATYNCDYVNARTLAVRPVSSYMPLPACV